MQLTLSAIAFLILVLLTVFIMKNRTKGKRRAIVGLIFLSTSSVALALALKSIYSLIFFASQWILLLMAISLALRELKGHKTKGL